RAFQVRARPNRTGGIIQDLCRDGPQQESAEPAVTTRWHYDKVHILPMSLFDDAVCRIPCYNCPVQINAVERSGLVRIQLLPTLHLERSHPTDIKWAGKLLRPRQSGNEERIDMEQDYAGSKMPCEHPGVCC